MKAIWTNSSLTMRLALILTFFCSAVVYAQQSKALGETTTKTAATVASIIAEGLGKRFVISGVEPLTDSTDSEIDIVTFAYKAGSQHLHTGDNETLWHLENDLNVVGAHISIALDMFASQGQFNPNFKAKETVVIPLGHKTIYRFLGTVDMKKLLDPSVAKPNYFLGGTDVSREQMRAIVNKLGGYTFIGELNPKDPLSFAFVKKVGLVHVGGKGTVILPSAKKITLGD